MVNVKHEQIIKEVREGNGNQFTVKEILQAHINEDLIFKEKILTYFSVTDSQEKVLTFHTKVLWASGSGFVLVLLWFIRYLIQNGGI